MKISGGTTLRGMSGRGRGKRSGSGPGPGRPPKFPNLQVEDQEVNRLSSSSVASGASAIGGGGLVEILNQLDSSKRNEMLALVGQYKGRVLGLNDFMMRARDLLGERLYAQLARDMSNAAAARGAGLPANSSMLPSGLMPPGIPHQMRPPMNASQMPMHSMPLIYGNQAPQQQQQPLSTPMMPSQYSIMQPAYPGPMEIDVTKMDTSSLQDVMQYSGVDLKAEAELLYRENEAISSAAAMSGGSAITVDHRLKFDYFFNPFKFRAIVQHALQRHFFSSALNNNNSNTHANTHANTTHANTHANTTHSNTTHANTTNSASDPAAKLNKPLGVSEEAVYLLGIAIQKRLIGIIRRLSEISRHRVDYGRGKFKIKIENDPKKQLWLQEKLFIEGIGEERRKANSSGNPAAGATPGSSSSTTSNASANQTLLNPPSIATVNAAIAANKSNASTAPAKAGGSTGAAQAGVDETVKTKLANSTALAALGVRQKSWMSAASTGPNVSGTGSSHQSSSSTSSNQTQNSNDPNEEKEQAEIQHPLASFYSLPSSTPLTDAELRAQYFNRTIAIIDLITCMETDPHLKRSRLLAVLYEALPRENKEYSKESNSNE